MSLTRLEKVSTNRVQVKAFCVFTSLHMMHYGQSQFHDTLSDVKSFTRGACGNVVQVLLFDLFLCYVRKQQSQLTRERKIQLSVHLGSAVYPEYQLVFSRTARIIHSPVGLCLWLERLFKFDVCFHVYFGGCWKGHSYIFGGMMFSFETNKELTSGTRREDDFTEPDLERHTTSSIFRWFWWSIALHVLGVTTGHRRTVASVNQLHNPLCYWWV